MSLRWLHQNHIPGTVANPVNNLAGQLDGFQKHSNSTSTVTHLNCSGILLSNWLAVLYKTARKASR